MTKQPVDSPLGRLLHDISTYAPKADKPELIELVAVVPPLVEAALKLDDQERRREIVDRTFQYVFGITATSMGLLGFVLIAPLISNGYTIPPWVPQLLGASGLTGTVGLVIRFLTGQKAVDWMFPSPAANATGNHRKPIGKASTSAHDVEKEGSRGPRQLPQAESTSLIPRSHVDVNSP